MILPDQYLLQDNGVFPNSHLPVLHYPQVLHLPSLFPAMHIRGLLRHNGWTNNWRAGIYTYHHYHSITHEAMAVIKGSTKIQLGGEDGIILPIGRGDVLVIPAGVAHRNTGREKDVICIGGYPEGKDFDMNYGLPGERPQTDRDIAALPIPVADPVYGLDTGLPLIWQHSVDPYTALREGI